MQLLELQEVLPPPPPPPIFAHWSLYSCFYATPIHHYSVNVATIVVAETNLFQGM